MHDAYPGPAPMHSGKKPIVESKKPQPVEAEFTNNTFKDMSRRPASRWPTEHPKIAEASRAYGEPKAGASSETRSTGKVEITKTGGPKG